MFIKRRSGRGVVTPKIFSPKIISPRIFSPKRLFIERIGVQSKPEKMSIISTEDLAIERISAREIEGIPDGEEEGTYMTPA